MEQPPLAACLRNIAIGRVRGDGANRMMTALEWWRERPIGDARELEGARRRGYFPTKPM